MNFVSLEFAAFLAVVYAVDRTSKASPNSPERRKSGSKETQPDRISADGGEDDGVPGGIGNHRNDANLMTIEADLARDESIDEIISKARTLRCQIAVSAATRRPCNRW